MVNVLLYKICWLSIVGPGPLFPKHSYSISIEICVCGANTLIAISYVSMSAFVLLRCHHPDGMILCCNVEVVTERNSVHG